MKAHFVSEQEVRAVPEVKGTSTWNPVHHSLVIDAVEHAVSEAGLGIQDKRFELTTGGGNLFASYRLDQGRDGVNWQIGFRNSIAKRFAVGITAGTYTMVCSNLVFAGDFVEFRKHTKGLDTDELFTMSGRAIETTVHRLESLEAWQLDLKNIPLSQRHMRILSFEAMRKQAFPASRFHRFLEAYREEVALNGLTLYTFYHSITRTIRDQSLSRISTRSEVLNQLVHDYQHWLSRNS